MSMMVARMQKMKADNLIGIGNHNQRKIQNHSNKEIDQTRSPLNYDLVQRTEQYKTDIQQYINENKASSRTVRKDAVLVSEWIITSDTDFFKSLTKEQTKTFFEVAKEYFAEKYGEENIRYAQVHLDERTPHMHLGIVPFTDDKRLSAKTIFNRQALQTIQNELPERMNEKGFQIERGQERSERKHLNVKEYKELKDKTVELENRTLVSHSKLHEVESELGILYEKQEELTQKIEEKEKEFKEFKYSSSQEIEKKPAFLKKGYSIVRTSELNQVETEASLSYIANSRYTRESFSNKQLERKTWRLSDELYHVKKDLGKKLKDAEKRLEMVTEELDDRWYFAKSIVKKLLNKNLDKMYEAYRNLFEKNEQTEQKQEMVLDEKEPKREERGPSL